MPETHLAVITESWHGRNYAVFAVDVAWCGSVGVAVMPGVAMVNRNNDNRLSGDTR